MDVSGDSPSWPELENALETCSLPRVLHLDAYELARPSYSERVPPRVEFNGSGLASVLAYMALNNPDGFDTLLFT